LRGGRSHWYFLSDRTIYLEGDRAIEGGSSDVEVNFLRLEGSDRSLALSCDRTIYLEGDRASKGGSSGVEVNFLKLEGSNFLHILHYTKGQSSLLRFEPYRILSKEAVIVTTEN